LRLELAVIVLPPGRFITQTEETVAAGDDLGPLVERLRATVLEGPGTTEPGLRQAIEERAAALSGRLRKPGGTGQVPDDLSEFVDRVATAAWTVTGEQVEALLAAGHSQDEVFEVSVSAALGAAHARLERGLAALRGEI
jgi:hypothetical protein